jgi:hypothetical protein
MDCELEVELTTFSADEFSAFVGFDTSLQDTRDMITPAKEKSAQY